MKNPKQPAHSVLGLAAIAFGFCVAAMLLYRFYQNLGFLGAWTLVALLSFLFETQRVDDGNGLGEHLADVDSSIDREQAYVSKTDREIEEMLRG
jgi:hypothetical protein